MYTLLKQENKARRGQFETVHGTFQTPCFMNVGTAGAIKGGVSSIDLKGLKTQVELCNTYHLHLRPGDKIIKQMGGLHKFINWDKLHITTNMEPDNAQTHGEIYLDGLIDKMKQPVEV